MRAIEKTLKYPKNWLRRLQNIARRDVQPCKKSHMISSGDLQKRSNVFRMVRGVTK